MIDAAEERGGGRERDAQRGDGPRRRRDVEDLEMAIGAKRREVHGRVARRARHHGESANRARASARTRDGVPKPREGGRFEFGDERERGRVEQRDAAARAADGDDAGAHRGDRGGSLEGRERGGDVHGVHVGGVDGGEEGGVRSVGCRWRDADAARATPATSTATMTAGAPGVGGGWLDDARHREEDVGEDDAHGARGGCADAAGRCLGEVDRGAVVGGDGPGEEAASSGVRGVAGGRAEVAPPAASGARVARARSLAPSTRTTRGGACSSRSTSAKPPMAAWGCERGALARDRAEGARSRTGPEEGADPTRARPEGTSTPRKTRGGECRERDDATPESRGDACARLAVWRRRDARICTRGGNPHRARARAPANAGERF